MKHFRRLWNGLVWLGILAVILGAFGLILWLLDRWPQAMVGAVVFIVLYGIGWLMEDSEG